MFTVCPRCALTLVVTAGDLRVGQGYVRCGRCSNVFNALVGLSEERSGSAASGASGPPASPATGTPVAPGSGAPPDSPPLEELSIELEPEPDAVPDTELEFKPDSTDLSDVFVEARPGPHDVSSGTFETIVLDSANDAEASDAEAANDASLEEPPRAANDSEAGEEPESSGFDRARVESPRPRRPAPETSTGVAAQAEATESDDDAIASEAIAESLGRGRSGRSRGRTILWSFGIAVLVIALAAQLVHHHRNGLAVDPRLREPLSAVYRAIGLTLSPRWNLAAYDVRQLGASAGGQEAGTLTVRATVQNSGGKPQPLPLLRVTVQDRFGNRIAARDVAPPEYAARAAAISTFLEVGERVDAEIRLADPGPNAVGFELDACLPFEGARIACANEQRGR